MARAPIGKVFCVPRSSPVRLQCIPPPPMKKTGHRIRYLRVDAEPGEEVANEDIIKGYPVDKTKTPREN